MMLVDVDNLGQINDAYGNDIGDKALARVAETVHTSLRESDLIAHYGADEFIVLMPEATRADAQRAAQLIHHDRLARQLCAGQWARCNAARCR